MLAVAVRVLFVGGLPHNSNFAHWSHRGNHVAKLSKENGWGNTQFALPRHFNFDPCVVHLLYFEFWVNRFVPLATM